MTLSTKTARSHAKKRAKRPAKSLNSPSTLLLLCILLCGPVGGCSVVKTIKAPTIPGSLLQPTPAPEWAGETVGDLVEYGQDYEAALAKANEDKAAIAAIVKGGKDVGQSE